MAINFNVNNRVPPNTPEEISEALKLQAKNIYSNMVNVFNRGSKMFWNNPNATPEQLSAALGNDAKQLFELHYQLGQLIATVNPADIAIGASVIGQFTMNQDGTVTIIQPTPEPTPE
jgi:hypothetical protein